MRSPINGEMRNVEFVKNGCNIMSCEAVSHDGLQSSHISGSLLHGTLQSPRLSCTTVKKLLSAHVAHVAENEKPRKKSHVQREHNPLDRPLRRLLKADIPSGQAQITRLVAPPSVLRPHFMQQPQGIVIFVKSSGDV